MFSESETVELKSVVVDDIKKEVIAFANTRGGKLYIGVADDGSVIGVDDTDSCIQQVANMLRDAIKPDITMFVGYSTELYEGKNIVVVNVEVGSDKPYYLVKKGLRPEGVYVRQGTTIATASERAIRNMIRKTDKYTFEDGRSLLQELSFIAMQKEFSSRGIKLEDAQFKTLGLVNEVKLFTNLGMLLADQNPHTIKAAVFQDCTPLIFRDRKEFAGSLFEQLNDAFAYIDFHNQVGARIEGLYRIDKRDYPPVAVREALLNCIVHRDYSFSASTIVSIYKDRIEFVSIGGLMEGIELEDVLGGISLCRNPKLAHIFYRLEFIEAYGTGLYKICDAYKDEAVKPDFKVTPNAFKVILPNVNYKREPPLASIKMEVKESTHSNIYGQESKIMKYLASNEFITRKDIEVLLNMPPASVVRLLKKMLQKGIIAKAGQGRNTRYYKS